MVIVDSLDKQPQKALTEIKRLLMSVGGGSQEAPVQARFVWVNSHTSSMSAMRQVLWRQVLNDISETHHDTPNEIDKVPKLVWIENPPCLPDNLPSC